MRHSKKKHFFSLLIFSIFLLSMGFFIGNKYSSKGKTVQASKSTENTTVKNASTNDTTKNTSQNSNKKSIENTEEAKKDIKQSTPDSSEEKSVYLTFDDGPSKKVTPQILKVLDKYNIKASFFLIGKSAKFYSDLVKQESLAGHAICNHTYCHNYNYLYSTPNNFVKDVQKCDTTLKSILNKDTNKIIRFPGGGFYKKRAVYRTAIKEAGFKYIDWHVETGDARANHVPVDKLLSNLKEDMNNCPKRHKNNLVVLMHDLGTKQTTVDALPKVINYFKSQGYTFKTLNEYPFEEQ